MIPPEPVPPGPDPPTPTLEPVALVLHVSSAGGYEDDLGISNGVISYLPPDSSEWITVPGGFSRALDTFQPVQFTGSLPVGSRVNAECDIFDSNGSLGHVELGGYFSGPTTLTINGNSYKTTADGINYDIVEVTDVYGWLAYCYYSAVS